VQLFPKIPAPALILNAVLYEVFVIPLKAFNPIPTLNVPVLFACKTVLPNAMLLPSAPVGLYDCIISLPKIVFLEEVVVNGIQFCPTTVLNLSVVKDDVELYPTEIFVGRAGSSVDLLTPLNKNLLMGEILVSIKVLFVVSAVSTYIFVVRSLSNVGLSVEVGREELNVLKPVALRVVVDNP
jgi:hypothetical protein